MNKTVSVTPFAGGRLLLIFGISASNSLGSDISRFITGSTTDKAVWIVIIGAVLAVVGWAGSLRGSK